MKPTSETARKALKPIVVLLFLTVTTSVQPLAGAPAAESAPYVARLEYRETSEVFMMRPVGFKLEKSRFLKEPALGKREVFRGLLQWGGRSGQPTPFIWDKEWGTLYLDLNRNRDLTDDPKGVVVSGTNSNHQTFTNVQLPRVTKAGLHPMSVQLGFSSYQAGTLYVHAGLCSYWEAKASLRGQDWQFGLVEDALEDKAAIAPQFVLLRPWAERERPFHLRTSSADFFDYSTSLFFGGQAYALDCRYDTSRAAPCYQATLKEQPARLAELNVTGASLHRLILTGDKGLMAILDQPKGLVKLPAGDYALEEIWLRNGDKEACRFKAGKITVDPQRPASLTAGGPLTNSVKVRSEGHQLSFNFELLGADGGAYRLPRPDYDHPPEFVLFQGTNRLAADKFKYG